MELYDLRIISTCGTKTLMTDRGINQLQGRLASFGEKKYII
jgi:hypothetical protein